MGERRRGKKEKSNELEKRSTEGQGHANPGGG